MHIQYGAVNVEITHWNWPSEEMFSLWKADFLSLDEAKYFDIYLLGGFLETLKNKKASTPDIDIIITGCDDLIKIEKLIVEGTRLGIEKYQVFVDVLWFDQLPVYADDASVNSIKTYLISNQWMIDGKVHKSYADAKKIGENLWEMNRLFPTQKQLDRIQAGYQYCRPVLISKNISLVSETSSWISKLEFEPLNYLVRTLLDNTALLDLKPVISGGFLVALFAEVKSIESAEQWAALVSKVEKEGFSALNTTFGDIDFYFTHDNPIWYGTFSYLVDDAPLSTLDESELDLVLPKPNHYCKWTNTYLKVLNDRQLRYQFIKNPIVSPRHVIQDFDLATSCIAWHDDQLFVHKDFENLFDLRKVQLNQAAFHLYSERDIYSRLFNALRAYKYANRLGFSLSKELKAFCDELYQATQLLDLTQTTPLHDLKGEPSNNPVPSSDIFKGVLQRFWDQTESYQLKWP